MDESTPKIRVLYDPSPRRDSIRDDGLDEKSRVDEYEAAIMSRIDDRLLRKIFSGLISQ